MTIITNDNIQELVRSYINNKEALPADLKKTKIGDWDVSKVTDMSILFMEWDLSNFNQPIGNWDVSNVTNMSQMFGDAQEFNQPIGDWNVSNVTDMGGMFGGATEFNQPIGSWNTAKVKDMSEMFIGPINKSSFNQPIGNWNTANVTNMREMFHEAEFNQPIGSWNTANVKDMRHMFCDAEAFNQPIGNWNTANVTNMSFMFARATAFNQPIGDWNVSNVTDMGGMFENAIAFNQPIGNWDVSDEINEIDRMFAGAISFSHPIPFVELDDMEVVIPDEEELMNYNVRVNSNVKIARTIQEYLSLCLTANKTDEACRKATCPICLTNFIVKGHLIRPVMFHKGVDSSGKEIWICPVHPEEQLKYGNKCAGCRTLLFIPESLKTDIREHVTEELVERSDATSGALRLQSALRGHRTRRSSVGKEVEKKVRRERAFRESRKAFHDSYAKEHPQDGGKKNKKHVRKVKTLRRARKTRRNRK